MVVIDLDYIRRVGAMLEAECGTLRETAAELAQCMETAKKRPGGWRSARRLELVRESVLAELAVTEKYADFAEKAAKVYRGAEEKIADRYNMEDLPWPRTVYGTSHFENLAAHRRLIAFKEQIGSGI